MREMLEKIELEDAAQAPHAPPPTPKPPAGWYIHPTMADTRRYWDGQRWTADIAPLYPQEQESDQQRPQPRGKPTSQTLGGLLVAGSIIGLVMSLQSASLLTGTGLLWTGVAITLGMAVAAWVIDDVSSWIWAACVLMALIAFANVQSVESQLDDTREEINEIVK